jgi:predicted esterase
MRLRLALALAVLSPVLLRCGGDDSASSANGGDGGPTSTTEGADASRDPTGIPDGASLPDGASPTDGPVSTLPTKSPGCGKAATASPASGDAKTVTVGGVSRSFLLYVPSGYDPTRGYPVVTVWHGIGATGPEMADFIKMQDYAAGNAIVAFPSAVGGQWDLDGSADLDFFDAMLASLESSLCVNEQRVFALGFSYGAYMVNHLGCNRSATLRAFVAADGGFPGSPAGCGKTAALIYHRTEDDNEAIANGRHARDLWLGINGCAATSTPVTSWGFSGLGCVAYDGCPSASPVLWCEDTATSPYKHDLRDVYRVPMWNWFNHF